MSTLFQGHYVQFFDDNGVPLSGGTVEFYEVGTSTPKDVYTDAALSIPAQSPVTLDAAGRATIWLNGDYKVRLKNSQGVLVEETDGINPPIDTETSGGNLIANGSFETAGNSESEASGWTLTAQSDGSVERITSDSYDGTAALKFTSDGSGGGQADTNAFFAVSPGRSYEISFALKCSVVDIRNLVQVRYFDKDKSHLSNSTVYDEDTSNPTSWTVKRLTDTPPANARFAKLRILGADQSDATAGEAKVDSVRMGDRGELAGFSGTTSDLNAAITTGLVQMYAGSSEPSGWLFCNGQAVPRSTYSALFNEIGTTFGAGNGSTTFNVPDIRDRSPLGARDMGATDAARVSNYDTALGDTGGEDQHTLTEAEMPSHAHAQDGGNNAGTSTQDFRSGSGENLRSNTSSSTGGDAPHNNMHPFLALNFIIKT